MEKISKSLRSGHVCCLLSGRAISLGCLRDRSSEWFCRRNRSDPTRSRAMTPSGSQQSRKRSQRAAEERYSGRAVTRWNPGLFSQPLDLITFCDFFNDPVLRIAVLVLAKDLDLYSWYYSENPSFLFFIIFSMFLASLGKKNNNK